MIIRGLKEAITALDKLESAVAKKILRKALRAGATLPLKAAKTNAPVRTGALRRSLKVRAGRSRKGVIHVVMGTGKKWFVGPMYYSAFVVMGHKQGSKRLGNARKDIPPNTFMNDAYEATKEATIDAISETMLAEIEKTAQQLGK